MRHKGLAAFVCLFLMFGMPAAFCLKPVEDSSEDLFWTDPMTVHDFKKNTDLHSISVSTMAITELEFVKLGDGLLNFSLRSKKNPIARSLDSLEYSYSKLPRVEPVERLEQLFDALQLRQISLADGRIVGNILSGGGMGGITPLMQLRAYKLVVWLEDILYDVDRAVMYPLNQGVSSIRKEPSRLKSIAYAADGLGAVRWEFFSGLKWFSREAVRMGSWTVSSLEKPHDAWIRHKRRKQNAHVLIYSKMPATVFKEHLSYFTGKDQKVFAGTLPEWKTRLLQDPALLPDNVRTAELPYLASLSDVPPEVIVAAEHKAWEKVPRDLKKYVITPDEVVELVRP